MQINLCFPTLSNYSGLAAAINSACLSKLRPTQINIIDNGGRFKEHFGDIKEIDGVPVDLFEPLSNTGVTRPFNHFLHKYDNYTIISNDDVIFNEDTIRLLVEAAEQNPNELIFAPQVYWEHYFSLFLIKKQALSIIGEFDSNFFAYFSDADYTYRMKLAGYKVFVVEGCTYEHVDGGSNTVRNGGSETKKINQLFAQEEQYYRAKWMGVRNCEGTTRAFNIF